MLFILGFLFSCALHISYLQFIYVRVSYNDFGHYMLISHIGSYIVEFMSYYVIYYITIFDT